MCRQFQIAESTWAQGSARHGGMDVDDAKRLKELEAENTRLKKLLAETELDKEMLREQSEGKILTPNRRRAAVAMLTDVFGVSERRACRVIGQHRSTQRAEPPEPSEDEERLREWLREFSRKRLRWGWRRAATQARKEGWVVNNKRIHRLWKDERLQVPIRRRKSRMRGIGSPVGSFCPIRPNVLWAMDFQFDRTIDGAQVKLLNIIDEYTRECLEMRVEHSIDADQVVATLDAIARRRGATPAFVRFDNGPEFVAKAVAEWCEHNDVNAVFIDPGSPWQNAWIESFNGKLRDELLNGWQFDSLFEAQVIIGAWRTDYNENRPHSALGGLTPNEYAQNWTEQNQPQLA